MSRVSPPGRALAILAVISVAAVVVLGWMANRYSKLVPAEPRSDATAARSEALRRVDQFLLVNHRLRTLPSADRAAAFRDQAMTEEEFERLAAALRAWRAGRLSSGDPYAFAFERRRDRLGPTDPAGG